jgi:16S rRNA processing protein RimM
VTSVAANSNAKIVVGRLGASYGVRGWLRVQSYTEEPEAIFAYLPWTLGRAKMNVEPVEWRRAGTQFVVKFTGVDSPEAARSWTGLDISVSAAQLPVLATGEYYWSQLLGMRVMNTSGVDLGSVHSLIETGANDVMVVVGECERLIPYLDSVVHTVNMPDRTIVVDWDAEY